MTAADGLDQLADRLYALPPTDFVPARDEAAKAARAAGDRSQAGAIAKLRRPTVAAWLVNLLALRRGEHLDELLALGAEMRTAQHELRGPDLRELATKRRAAIGGLVGEAVDLAVASGAARGGLPVAEVEATLAAAVADGSIADEVRAGHLVKSVHYDGFGEPSRAQLHLVPDQDQTPPVVRATETATADARAGVPKLDPRETRRAEAAARDAATAAELESAAAAARDAVTAASADREEKDEAVTAATERVADVDARLVELRRERVAAQTSLRQAEQASLVAKQAFEAAQRASTAADRAAARATTRAKNR